MSTPLYEVLDHNIVCIDALYTAPKVACLYLIQDAGEYAFIETGTNRSVPNIVATLNEFGVAPKQVRYIIPTHVHLDHAGAAGALMNIFPNAELLIHPRGARHLIDPTRLIKSSMAVYGEALFEKLYGEIIPIPKGRVRQVADNEYILLGRRELIFRHLRGHADHHFCIFDAQSQGWFSGDMFGFSYPSMRFETSSLIVPATTPTQFDPDLYCESVCELAKFKPSTMYLTHFGALDFDPCHVEQLSRQLQAYSRFGEESDGDIQQLEKRINQLIESEMNQLLSTEEQKRHSPHFGEDILLNAQGIAWWAKNRRRR